MEGLESLSERAANFTRRRRAISAVSAAILVCLKWVSRHYSWERFDLVTLSVDESEGQTAQRVQVGSRV